MAKYIDDVNREESFKEAHDCYLSLEQDILDRSVTVQAWKGCESLDLPVFEILARRLVDQFGTIESCATGTQRKGQLAMNVTFCDREDVLSIFRSKSMRQVRSEQMFRELSVPENLGDGVVILKPALKDKGFVTAHKSDVRFESLRLSLGHFVPPIDEDIDLFGLRKESMSSTTSLCDTDDDFEPQKVSDCEFLEERNIKSGAKVKIDVARRLIDIEVNIQKLQFVAIGKFQPTDWIAHQYRISFRFKAFQGRMHLVREVSGETAGYSLVMKLNYPPRLYKQGERGEYIRCGDFIRNSRGTFSRCLALRLHISLPTVQNLLKEKALLKTLHSYGIIKGQDFSCKSAPIIYTREVAYEHKGEKRIETALKHLKSRKVGK